MTDVILFTDPQLYPFTFAVCIIVGVLILEILMSMFGMSMFIDADADVDFDIDVSIPDIDADIDIALGVDSDTGIEIADAGGLWGFLELGRVPFMVWLLGFIGGFAMAGFFVQLTLDQVFGMMLPQLIIVPIAVVLGLIIGKFISQLFSILIPKETTESMDKSFIGGSIGNITVGVATKDNPAEARIQDRHGNSHLIRVVPFTNEPDLAAGTEILILRGKGPVYQAMSMESVHNR